MNDIDTYIKNKMKYLKLASGESFTGVYMGFTIGPNRFKPEEEIASFKLKFTDSDKTIVWNCGRMDVAKVMAKKSIGEVVKITRSGSGQKDTSYTIEAVV